MRLATDSGTKSDGEQKALELALHRSNAEKSELRRQIDTMQAEIAALKLSVARMDAIREELDDERRMKASVQAELKEQLAAAGARLNATDIMAAEHQRALDKVAELEKLLDVASRQMINTVDEHRNDEIRLMQTELDELRIKVPELLSSKEADRLRLADLETKLHESRLVADRLQTQIDSAKMKLAEDANTIDRLRRTAGLDEQKKIESMNEWLAEANSNNQRLSARINELERQLKESIENAETTMNTLNTKIDELRSTNAGYEVTISSLRDQLRTLTKAKQTIEEQLRTVENNMRDANENNEELRTREATLNDRLEQMLAINEKLKRDASVEDELVTLVASLQSMRTENEAQRVQITDLRLDVAKLRADNDRLTNESDAGERMRVQLHNAENECNSLRLQIAEQKKQVEAIDRLKGDAERRIDEIERRCTALTKANDQLRSDVERSSVREADRESRLVNNLPY
jgi:chromosome segregation ATPase